jgi:hypothetical protein
MRIIIMQNLINQLAKVNKRLESWGDAMVKTLDTVLIAEHYDNGSKEDKDFINFMNAEVVKFNVYLLELINYRAFVLAQIEDSKPAVSTEIAEMESDLNAFVAQCEAKRVELKGNSKAIITKRMNNAKTVLQLIKQIAYNPSSKGYQLDWLANEAHKALIFYFK